LRQVRVNAERELGCMILYLMTVQNWSSEAGMFSRRLESPAEKLSIWEDRGRRARLLIRMKISEIITTVARAKHKTEG
jgi:hypothetical protein